MRLSAIRSRWHWLLLLGLPLLAFASYYGKGLSTDNDNLLHLYRLVALHKNIVEGNFYPRWMGELFLGFGYPLLNFYASSTYYLAELLHLVGAGYENALIYAMLLLLILASIGIYRLAIDLFAEFGVTAQAPALLATAAYVFAPYLLFNLYVRGAIAELGAQAILPWLLWAFRRLLCSAEPGKYAIWAIVSLAGLAFTHTISLVLVPPILIVYALVLLWRFRADRREVVRRLMWFAFATGSAAAISAVFWLPALLERQFLTTQALEAANLHLPEHVWTWATYVDADWFVGYNDAAATSLRRVQLVLAIFGMVLGRKWNGEWRLMALLALVSCLLAGAWAMPLWRSNALLLTIQFPWRMLGIASLPLALLTGGILTRDWQIPRTGSSHQAIGLVLLIGLVVYVNFPRMAWLERLDVEPEQVNLTSISQYEAITGRYGLSAATFREFTPRWVNDLELKSVPPLAGERPLAVTLDDASAQTLAMNVTAATPSRLLFSTLYFPGWQAQFENGQSLAPYPASDFGLLAVDLPAGEHHLSVQWGETAARNWGRALSLLSLLLLGLFCLSQPSLRLFAIYPFAPLLMVAVLTLIAPAYAPTYVQTPDQPIEQGIQLLGYTTYQEDAEAIYLFPHWYVEQVPGDLQMHWQLLDQAQQPITTLHSFPYFNTLRAFQWSANMVVDDGYYFPLPPGLAAGDYSIALAVTPAGDGVGGQLSTTRVVGKLNIAQNVPALPQFAHSFDAHFQAPAGSNRISLRGYNVVSGNTAATKGPAQTAKADLTVAPGDTITYTLYWQSDQAIPVGIQVFNQLLDHNRRTLTQINQPLELSYGAPYYLWNPYWVRQNSYRLQIPEDAAGGLYQPYLGIYTLETKDRFVASEADGAEIGDALFLPPIKVARRTATPLATAVSARFGEVIQLESYMVEMPSGGLHPQSTLTLTVQYASLSPTPVDYTQFIHLRNGELGMAAQVDTPPQGNGNPTSTWIVGEKIVDVIPLTIGADARPGRYTLSIGLYDPLANGARLPVVGQNGQLLPDNQVVLEGIGIE